MTINDLTKEELIQLIKNKGWFLALEDIKRVRCQTLVDTAKKQSDEALQEMQENTGSFEKIDAWNKAHKKFDQAMILYKEANKLMERKERVA